MIRSRPYSHSAFRPRVFTQRPIRPAPVAVRRSQQEFIPGPRGDEAARLLHDFFHDPLRILVHVQQEYGDIVALPPFVVLSHPRHFHHVLMTAHAKYGKTKTMKRVIGEGLTTAEGKAWQQQRVAAQPQFTMDALHRHIPIIMHGVGKFIERLSHMGGDAPINIAPELARLSIELSGLTMFNVDLSGEAETVHRDLNVVENHHFYRAMGMTNAMDAAERGRFQRSDAALQAFGRRILEHCRRTSPPPPLFARLPIARPGEGPDDQYLCDQIITYFIGAFYNTSSTLAFAVDLLARHPEYATLPMQQIILETLRLYPPVYHLARKPLDYDTIDGYAIQGDQVVILFPYATHRDPKIWGPDAAQFKPQRFADPAFARARTEACEFIPFGKGPRNCIGDHMALMEIQIILTEMLRRFSFAPVLGSEPLHPLARLTLSPPSDGVWIQLRKCARS